MDIVDVDGILIDMEECEECDGTGRTPRGYVCECTDPSDGADELYERMRDAEMENDDTG